MILTCPECSTSYFVDDSKIPPEGRVVKCASCGARWTATLEQDSVLAAPVSLDLTPPDPAVDSARFEPPPPAADEEEALPPLTADDLPKKFRAKADTERRVREAATTGIVWAAMAASLVVILALAVVFRVNVVRLWPKTAGAYAGVGLPVNSLGLAIESVRAEPSLQRGHAALSVSGVIRNIEGRTIETPPLRISLLDKDGNPVATKIARAADPRVPPGETRHFALVVIDPPKTAHDLEVAFAPEAAGHAPKAAKVEAPGHAAPALRGPAHAEAPAAAPPAEGAHDPAPVDAVPLPADSPYALEHHD